MEREEGPGWLNDVKGTLVSSVEWQALTQLVYEKVQESLEQNHVSYLADLSEDEKAIMLDNIEERISDGAVHRSFSKLLAETLELKMSSLLESKAHTKDFRRTRTEALVETAARGLSEMLRRIPTQITTIRLLLNQEIPLVLRRQVWGMILHDSEALNAYKARASGNRMSTISTSDATVTETLQEHFENEFPEISDSSSYIMIGKTVLSYRATSQGSIDPSEYYLIIPVIHVFARSYADLPRVVEAFHALQGMPRLRCRENAFDDAAMMSRRKTLETFNTLMQEQDEELWMHLLECMKNKGGPEQASAGGMNVGFAELFCKSIENLFVGTVSMDACQYIWDQCLLVGFEKLQLPFLICILILLRDQILPKNTLEGCKHVFTNQAKSITVRSLAGEMEKRFLASIRESAGLPLRRLSHWKNDPVPALNVDKHHAKMEELQAKRQALEQEGAEVTPQVEEADIVKEKLEKQFSELVHKGEHVRDSPPENKENQETHEELNDSEEQENQQQQVEQREEEEQQEQQVELTLPAVDPDLNYLADTVKRAEVLNPGVDTELIVAKVLDAYPEMKGQSASEPVLRVMVDGKPSFYRMLRQDEPKEKASAIVQHELERLESNLDKLSKLAKHLIRFSEAKSSSAINTTQQQQPDQTQTSPSEHDSKTSQAELLRNAVLQSLRAIEAVRNLARKQ